AVARDHDRRARRGLAALGIEQAGVAEGEGALGSAGEPDRPLLLPLAILRVLDLLELRQRALPSFLDELRPSPVGAEEVPVLVEPDGDRREVEAGDRVEVDLALPAARL